MAEERNEVAISFAAIDPYIERLIESPVERKTSGRWVYWGEKNTYPQYVKGLCKSVPTLRTVTMGMVDYVCGNAIHALRGLDGRAEGAFDRRGTQARELVKKTAANIAHLGGFAWKITLNGNGMIGEIENIPVEYLRMDEDGNNFYYSEKWADGYARNTVIYPRWVAGTKEPESILLVKVWGDELYPEPVFAASVKACETERSIDNFHLGNIERGFMGSYLVNFNGGARPTDQERKEIERNFTEKFGGHRNAGRIMFSWNANVQNRTTFEKMEVADYGEKYKTLSAHCQKQIFTAFRANPNLFGVATESNGFNSEEYEQAFKLFNRTMIQPIQQQIIDALELVMGEKGVLTIEPFTLDGGDITIR